MMCRTCARGAEKMRDGDAACVFRTRTRVATTDPEARRRFRRYWSIFAPGILLIRLEALRMLRASAQHAAAA